MRRVVYFFLLSISFCYGSDAVKNPIHEENILKFWGKEGAQKALRELHGKAELATCFHEAGHALAVWLFEGRVVEWISLYRYDSYAEGETANNYYDIVRLRTIKHFPFKLQI